MPDPRYHKLAQQLASHSTELQSGERVLIELFDVPSEMGVALLQAVRELGAIPYISIYDSRIQREILRECTEEQLSFTCTNELRRMKGMQAYIAIRGAHNIFESSDVPNERMKLASKILRPVMDWRVKKTKWVVLRWPTSSMAQQALMSTSAFEDFYFQVCTLNYAALLPAMERLKKVMDQTDQVHLKGPGTDLRFSIKDIGSVICGGKRNIPDGEVFSCPIKKSVEGEIQFNTPTLYQGVSFDKINLKFHHGKIISATCNGDVTRLNQILDSDEGARYIGEFSLGFNPHILHPMRDILFDEKISGSFHFTPGQAYEEADNGNRSQVHWDMVNIQRKDYGGGEVWFDGNLTRKDGLFVTKELSALNPNEILKLKA